MVTKVQFKPRQATDAIFVHCSATPPTMDIGRETIEMWHKQQGWLAIGYHFIIKRDGTVEEGRPVDVVGSHVKYWNSRSVGVCLVGGVNDKGQFEANFTPAQMNSLRNKLADLKSLYPQAEIKAHHDIAPKACPSFDLQRWLTTNELVTSDRG
ncbi:endolysin [Salmonella phage STP-SP1]|uniref:Endolysin n=1 Tax=Salmonella phage PRF-SP1 TaxID=2873462 RepID=A0AAE9BQI3_9CAUD|nr:endolysin [Salmonella phage PRF-SP1]UFZ20901.1 endolysin [Salmonella phage PRF-SP3]UIS44176.1 endolysin [Salmonella phage PRF-SP4]UIS44245.1 endolysin [Salmonella phage PRF-SP5]UOL48319.1 endolysin [Salmonella phage PRF-SP2]WNO24914.1 endolysin [Salmonella phage PRF-SP11]WOZ56377.1 endolysin [Salmonella phage PRF-SP9]WOZ56434.1 endolysin [Salmonella phage PRF-SP10]WPJ68038.1 endolysin [Salmonella phage PRF-SP7]WPJ68106.1 endolysin [Salmonella phage PRF-SP8]WPJ68155.1 endolysin [Salmone